MIDKILVSLDIMWKGMLSIFVVIIILTLLVIAFQWFEKKFLSGSEKKDDN